MLLLLLPLLIIIFIIIIIIIIRIIICRHTDSSGSGVEDSRGGKSILSSHV